MLQSTANIHSLYGKQLELPCEVFQHAAHTLKLPLLCLRHVFLSDSAILPPGASKEEVAPARCHYGTLPGGWIRSKGRALLPWHEDNSLNVTFPVWQPYCSQCQMKPLLAPYLVVRQPLATLERLLLH